MEVDICYYFRTIADLKTGKDLGFEDPNGILNIMSKNVRETLCANPSLFADEDVCQIIALDGNKVVGSELSFPNRFIVDGEVKSCRGASTLFVNEEYRKYAVGTILMMKSANIDSKQDSIVAGISQVAYPIYKAMRYACLSFKRYIYLRKSRVAVEYIFKNNLRIICFISKIVDLFISMMNFFMFAANRWKMRSYKVEIVNEVPIEIEKIVMDDRHKYKELHDKKWFEWNLHYSFNDDGRNSKFLAIVKDRNEHIVGFFVNKVEFFEKASSRGFKNVLLGTVSEWGIEPDASLTEFDIQMTAIRYMPNNIDGAQVASTDEETIKKFRHHMFYPMGEANMAAYVQSFKDKTINDINEWRVRIAAGDTLLN